MYKILAHGLWTRNSQRPTGTTLPCRWWGGSIQPGRSRTPIAFSTPAASQWSPFRHDSRSSGLWAGDVGDAAFRTQMDLLRSVFASSGPPGCLRTRRAEIDRARLRPLPAGVGQAALRPGWRQKGEHAAASRRGPEDAGADTPSGWPMPRPCSGLLPDVPHLQGGSGSCANPFPSRAVSAPGRARAHPRNPMEPSPRQTRRLCRSKLATRVPRSVPDKEFDEDLRSPALQQGPRPRRLLRVDWRPASELLSVTQGSVDPDRQLIAVVRKGHGTGARSCPPRPTPSVAALYQLEMQGLTGRTPPAAVVDAAPTAAAAHLARVRGGYGV